MDNNKIKEAFGQHTPEPWKVYNGEEIHGVLDSAGKHLAEMWQRKDYDSSANARRIVACVNACAGMDDPKAEIEQLKKDIFHLKVKCNTYAQRLVLEGFDDVEWEVTNGNTMEVKDE